MECIYVRKVHLLGNELSIVGRARCPVEAKKQSVTGHGMHAARTSRTDQLMHAVRPIQTHKHHGRLLRARGRAGGPAGRSVR
jgi:hypothetical protein